MRPRRKILLIDSVGDRQAITRYVLGQLRYAVHSARSLSEARTIAADNDVDLLLGYHPTCEQSLVALARTLDRPSLFVISREEQCTNLADATLTAPSMAELIDHVLIMSARPRGPRSGFHWEFVNGERKAVRNFTTMQASTDAVA